MRLNAARLLLVGGSCLPIACVAFGYDFAEYQPASAGSGGEAGGEHDVSRPTTEAHAGQTNGGGASASAATPSEGGAAPGVTTFATGGELRDAAGGERSVGDGGAGGGGAGDCEPRGCRELESECGSTDDGCGRELDCGECSWWFESCWLNRCVIPYLFRAFASQVACKRPCD